MKKILLIAFIAFGLVATGSAMAWKVDIDAHVHDATLDMQFETTGEDFDGDAYLFGTTAGVDGTGNIDIYGRGHWNNDMGFLTTEVESRKGADMYATQTLGVQGCLIDCAEEPCNECPEYTYVASSGATIDGTGKIFLAEGENVGFCDNYNGQVLAVHGEGDFTAGMGSTLWIGDEEPVTHAMGAWGENVEFCAFGIQGMDNSDGENSGYFTAHMSFNDDGCPEDDCDDCCPK